MDRSLVLTKTAKGLEEMKARAHGLPQKLRMLMIVVDGTMTAGHLIEKLGNSAETEAGLESLIAEGFLEVAKPGTPVPAARAAAAEAPPEIDLGGG